MACVHHLHPTRSHGGRPRSDRGLYDEQPFPVPRPLPASPGDVETAIAEGCYRDEDNDSCWIEHSELGRIGFLRLEDLSEGASLFDLRLNGPYPGRGLGDQVDRPDQR